MPSVSGFGSGDGFGGGVGWGFGRGFGCGSGMDGHFPFGCLGLALDGLGVAGFGGRAGGGRVPFLTTSQRSSGFGLGSGMTQSS